MNTLSDEFEHGELCWNSHTEKFIGWISHNLTLHKYAENFIADSVSHPQDAKKLIDEIKGFCFTAFKTISPNAYAKLIRRGFSPKDYKEFGEWLKEEFEFEPRSEITDEAIYNKMDDYLNLQNENGNSEYGWAFTMFIDMGRVGAYKDNPEDDLVYPHKSNSFEYVDSTHVAEWLNHEFEPKE